MATQEQLIQNTYNNQLAMLDAQKKQQEAVKQQQQKLYADQQKATNRGLYSTYMQAINPFGSNAEQRGISGTAISDYAKNQAYGTYLSGLGTAQNTYNQGLQDIENTWQNYLLEDQKNRLQAAQDRDNNLLALEIEKENQAKNSGGGYYSGGYSDPGMSFYDAQPTRTKTYNSNISNMGNNPGYTANGKEVRSIITKNGKQYYVYTDGTTALRN